MRMQTTAYTTSMVISPPGSEAMQAGPNIATDQHASIRPAAPTRLSSAQSRVHLARSASWSPAAHMEDPNSVAFTFFEDDLLPHDDWSKSEASLANTRTPHQLLREFKRYPPDVIPGRPAVEPAQESKITISRTLLVSEQQRAQTIEAERTLPPPSPSLPPLEPHSAPLFTALASENKHRPQPRKHEWEESDHRSTTANVSTKDIQTDKEVSVRNKSNLVQRESHNGIVTSAEVKAALPDNGDLNRNIPDKADMEMDNDRATMNPVQGPRSDKEDFIRGVTLVREPSLRAREPSTLASTLARSVSFFGRKSKDATKDTKSSSRPITPTKKLSRPLLKSFSSNSIPALARSDLPFRPLSVVMPLQSGVQTLKTTVQPSSKTRDELWNAFRALDAEYNK